jgi:hypothetical protein
LRAEFARDLRFRALYLCFYPSYYKNVWPNFLERENRTASPNGVEQERKTDDKRGIKTSVSKDRKKAKTTQPDGW